MAIDLADGLERCVRCGLCLPHCPTFQLTGDEAESPRGRIVLLQGLLDGAVVADRSLLGHLDSCLQCRRCEIACPAEVPFGSIMDAARIRIPPKAWLSRILRSILRRAQILRFAMGLARVIASFTRTRRTTGSSPMSRALHLTRFVGSRAAPAVATPTEDEAPRSGTIALFTGCLDPWMNPRAVEDAAWVIEAMGFRCVIPEDQGCCGALHQHAGDVGGADACSTINTAAFDRADADRIVFLSTGCGMTLTTANHSSSIAVEEICSWIERVLDDSRPTLGAVSGEIGIHRPCSAAHAGDVEAPTRLLRRIPGLVVHTQQPGIGCCGAAGSYIIDGEHAARLGQIAAASIAPGSTPTTPNLGCALQLAIHCGRSEPVLHPISVLRVSLDGGGSIA